MRFNEQGLLNLEALERRHNTIVHAVEQETKDAASDKDTMLEADHETEEEEKESEEEPDNVNVQDMEFEQDPNDDFVLPQLAL